METRPSEGDRIDKDYCRRLHLIYHGDKWLHKKSKVKIAHAPDFWLVNYFYVDDEEPHHIDGDIPTHEPPFQWIPVLSHPSVDIPSSSTFVPLSSSCLPPTPTDMPPRAHFLMPLMVYLSKQTK